MTKIERDSTRRDKEGFRYLDNVAGHVVYDEELGEIMDRRIVEFPGRGVHASMPEPPSVPHSKDDTATRSSTGESVASNVESCPPSSCDAVRRSLFGLALSGGGIRSGAVNLGVFKSLNQHGLLRYVDYLSTVSGGGYAGAYLSSATLQPRKKKPPEKNSTGATVPNGCAGTSSVDHKVPQSGRDSELPHLLSAFEGTAGESARMQRFIYRGNYLMSVTKFVNRHLVGMLLVWTVVASGLIAASSLVTWLFRSLDEPRAMETLNALGCESDVSRALFPSFVIFIFWLMAWGMSYILYRSRALGSTARFLFGGLVFSLLVGIACLLGTGDISLGSGVPAEVTDGQHVADASKSANRIADVLSKLVLGGILAGLLPYLSPGRLVRSGTRPRNAVEKVTFAVATRMLLFGVPFLIVSWFAREDVSQIMQRRPPLLARGFIKDWGTPWAPLWTRIRAEREEGIKNDAPPKPGTKLWKMSEKPFAVMLEKQQELEVLQGVRFQTPASSYDPENTVSVDSSRNLDYSRDLALSAAGRACRLVWDFAELTGTSIFNRDRLKDNRLSRIATAERELRQAKDSVVGAINQELLRPDFYKHFDDGVKWLEQIKKENRELDGRDAKKLRELVDRARGLHLPQPDAGGDASLKTEEGVRQLVSINRQILDAWYPNTLKPSTEIFAHVVLAADQDTRLTWFWWSLGVFLLAGMIVDLNTTSWHGYYARSLAENWIEPVPGLKYDIPLSQLETTSVGSPYHLISASMQMLGRQHEPGKSSHDHFLFSKRYCGSPSVGYVPSEKYMDGEISLPDAIAMSGGAISPGNLANPLLRSLMFLANFRLGKWMENPNGRRIGSDILQQIGSRWPVAPLRILSRMWMPAEERPFCFITDGGMDENLGIGALLRRRCRLILAVDAGQDADYEFADLAKLFRWARVRQGVIFEKLAGAAEISKQIEELAPLAPKREPNLTRMSAGNFSKRHFLVMRIKYPEHPQHSQDVIHPKSPPTGLLVYVKASLTGDEPLELQRFAAADGEFPHNSTSDQFYAPDRFESYRQLGEHVTEVVCRELPDLLAAELESLDPPAPHIREVVQQMRDEMHPGSQPDVIVSASPDTSTLYVFAEQSVTLPVSPYPESAADSCPDITSEARIVDYRAATTITASIGIDNIAIKPPAKIATADAEDSPPSAPQPGSELIPPTAEAAKLTPVPTANFHSNPRPAWNPQWIETLRNHRAEPSARQEAVLALEPYLADSDEVLRSFLDALNTKDDMLANVIVHSLCDVSSAEAMALIRDYGMTKKFSSRTQRRVVNLLGELCWRGKIELDDATFAQLAKLACNSRNHQLAEAAAAALDLYLSSLVRIQTNPKRQARIREILQRHRLAVGRQ